MKSPTITTQRVEQLLASYGSLTDSWPKAERNAALELINNSNKLKAQWLKAQRLDRIMGLGLDSSDTKNSNPDDSNVQVDNAVLMARILNSLPPQEQPAETITQRPSVKRAFVSTLPFKGMLAAGLAIFITAVVTFNMDKPDAGNGPATVAQLELEQWFWEDITGETNRQSDAAVDFMAIIDFEQLEDFQ